MTSRGARGHRRFARSAGRGRVLLFLAGIATVSAVVVAAFLASGDDALGPPPDDALASYRIVYRVEARLDPPDVTRRVVTVRRPFDSRDETFPPADAPSQGFLAVGRRLFLLQGDQALDLGERPPQVPPGDVRLAPQLEDLERLDVADLRGSSEVAGRRCRVYRLGSPIGDPVRAPTDDEYADLCFDDDGLLLSERWYVDGALLRETRALSVDLTFSEDDAFDLAGADRAEAPGVVGRVEELPRDEPPDTGFGYWVVDRPPWDFRLAGRWRALTVNTTEGVPAVQDVTLVDTYVRGTDVITVEHRESGLDGADEAGVERVTAGDLGEGRFLPTFLGPELRFDREDSVVIVRGSVSPSHLREFASRLRHVAPRREDGN